MTIWRVKKGFEQKIRSRHPWIFANEFAFPPKGILPGDLVEVQDERGNFLARGFGNPNSQIAFRALSFNKEQLAPQSEDSLVHKIVAAWNRRLARGFNKSYRIVFSEADELPGLILDHYQVLKGQCLVLQINGAGIDKIFQPQAALQILKRVVSEVLGEAEWMQTSVLFKSSNSSRKMEGLAPAEVKVIQDPIDLFSKIENKIILENLYDAHAVSILCNLIEGQKTGLFLDQSTNIKLVAHWLRDILHQRSKSEPVRILDLCCYMGQWSVYLVPLVQRLGFDVEVVLVDVSDLALTMAKQNVESASAYDSIIPSTGEKCQSKMTVRSIRLDVLDIPDQVKEEIGYNQFDVVISDPPAFVKNRKSLETGLHGYMKLNELAFKCAKSKGLVVSCTCSGLVDLPAFKESLRKALLRSGKFGQIIAVGGQGADHPVLPQFPEGEYLQMVLHHLD